MTNDEKEAVEHLERAVKDCPRRSAFREDHVLLRYDDAYTLTRLIDEMSRELADLRKASAPSEATVFP